MLWIPQCLGIRLTDGGEVIDLEFFSIYLILSITLGLGFAQPLKEMST
jgi:hypothetical protein